MALPLNRTEKQGQFQLSPIKAMEIAAAKVPNAISLAQGIPNFSTPAVITDFIQEKIKAGVCDKYSLTNGLAELREELALSLEGDGLRYDPDSEIIVTVGSIEGVTASILACTAPGDEVIIPSPTYASYLGAIHIARCTPRFVPLDEDHNFDFHVEQMASAISKKTKAILYCSPNNPTGTLYSEEKTRAIAALAQQHNLTIIIDEVYKDFYYTTDKHFTPAVIPEARERIIRVCSFSKAFAMTGWRVGFLHGDASRVQQILKFHDAMVSCAPVVSQYGAIAALRFGQPVLEKFRDEYKERRDYTIGMLDQMSHLLDYQTPKATYFAFPRIKDTVPLAHDSNRLAYDILEKVGVALVPGIAFGPSGESHLRITFGRDRDYLMEGMNRLLDYFSASRTRKLSASPLNVTTSASASHSSAPSWIRSQAKRALALAARLFLRRNRPTIIGIAGTRGKTVFKRTIADLLNRHTTTRASILSYNTEWGLPLSILELLPPRTLRDKIRFPFRVLKKALLDKEKAKLLVLEYGIGAARDGALLRSIANPDWLVISGFISGDANIDAAAVYEGICQLCKDSPKERVLWAADEPPARDLAALLSSDCALELTAISPTAVEVHHEVYPLRREFAGQSAKLAVIAAIMLAHRLGVPKEEIRSYLAQSD